MKKIEKNYILGLLAGIIMGCIVGLLSWIVLHKIEIAILTSLFTWVVIEELAKFIPLRFAFKPRLSHSVVIGLGFGLVEFVIAVIMYQEKGLGIYFARIAPLAYHVVWAMIMGYFISKKKSLLGLIIAILLHTLYVSFLMLL